MSSSPADRLLETAARLFYSRGIVNVGINEIISRAKVARMTLYHHYPSKDDLVMAVLNMRKAEREQWFKNTVDKGGNSRTTLINVFQNLANWTLEPGFRGCPLVLGAIELGGQVNAAQTLLQEHKIFIHKFFLQELINLGHDTPTASEFSSHLCLLYDGVTIGAFSESSDAPAELALKIVKRLLQ